MHQQHLLAPLPCVGASRTDWILILIVFPCLVHHMLGVLTVDASPVVTTSLSNNNMYYNFAIMPKNIGNPFFDPVREGCEKRAQDYTDRTIDIFFPEDRQIDDELLNNNFTIEVRCEWVGPELEDATGQAQVDVLEDIIEAHVNGTHLTHGIAISATNGPSLVIPIGKALMAGISVICFDSDSEESDRQAYVGTDNFAFGVQLAKVLEQLEPTGGKLALLTIAIPNLDVRAAGLRNQITTGSSRVWKELPNSVIYQNGTMEEALQEVSNLKREYPDLKAIVPLYGRPMRNDTLWKMFVEDNRDMTFVVADAMPNQIELMEQDYADGLVGQLPYQSGQQCIDTLLSLQLSGNPARDRENDVVFGTNLSFMLRIPLLLPKVTVDRNQLDSLVIMGYVLFSNIALVNLLLMAWVIVQRKTRVVAAGQPLFLISILCGVLILALAIIPLGMEDDEHDNDDGGMTKDFASLDAACMAVPWLISVGFGVIFSALFSKLWRIHRLIQSSMQFSKVQVRIQDVMWPFCVLMVLNVSLLSAWTSVAPLRWQRNFHEGTDPWNRSISSYGSCTSSGPLPFLIPLILINFGALMVANYQAFKARHIKSILSESKYIAVTVASMTQAFVVGLPVLWLVDEEPKAHYVVSILLIFCTGMAVMGFIFFPKVLSHSDIQASEASRLDSRYSNLGVSLRRSMDRSHISSYLDSSIAEHLNTANRTVAQIRKAAESANSIGNKFKMSGDKDQFISPTGIVRAPSVAVVGEKSSLTMDFDDADPHTDADAWQCNEDNNDFEDTSSASQEQA